MLFSLPPLVATLVPGGISWLSDGSGDAPLRSGNMPVTPHDPPTLTLALIGIGTIAIYLAATRRSRRDVPNATGRLSDHHELLPAAADLEEMPSRGAA